jgi:glutathione peroxidase
MSKLGTLKMYLHRAPKLEQSTDLYEHTVVLLGGGELDMDALRGHPTLVVNTASKCGFTPQFEGLESLYETYHERGLEMLGSPSGDFADQEFEHADDIGAFCEKNYGVKFPMTERTSVRENPGPFWSELTAQPNASPPAWNFNKYLIGPDGHLIHHWGSKTKPDAPELIAAIESVLPD